MEACKAAAQLYECSLYLCCGKRQHCSSLDQRGSSIPTATAEQTASGSTRAPLTCSTNHGERTVQQYRVPYIYNTFTGM